MLIVIRKVVISAEPGGSPSLNRILQLLCFLVPFLQVLLCAWQCVYMYKLYYIAIYTIHCTWLCSICIYRCVLWLKIPCVCLRGPIWKLCSFFIVVFLWYYWPCYFYRWKFVFYVSPVKTTLLAVNYYIYFFFLCGSQPHCGIYF